MLDPHLLRGDNSDYYILLLNINNEAGKGFHRNFFSGKSYLGYKYMDQENIEIVGCGYGQNAKTKFDVRVNEAGWSAANITTQTYY